MEIFLQMWDVGLRPLFRPLVRLANCVDLETRLESKKEICDTIYKISKELIENYRPGEQVH